jgi:hypothetical protein
MVTADLAGEAARLHRRYLVEIVEELGLCPWARRARLDGRLRQHVSLAREADAALAETTEAVERVAADEGIDVAFVIFPSLEVSRRAFDDVTARVIEAEAARHPLGAVPFMIAAFHPDAPPDTKSAERLIPFLRRTPDPCLQLVRARVLDSVRERTPQGTQLVDIRHFDLDSAVEEVPLRERIARQNLDTARRVGLPELARRLEDIRADRDRTYAALRAGRE